jgi:hypothetical protein
MTSDTTLLGAALISLCIIAGGIMIGARIFSVEIPYFPFIMVALAGLVVLGAASLLVSCRKIDGNSPGR